MPIFTPSTPSGDNKHYDLAAVSRAVRESPTAFVESCEQFYERQLDGALGAICRGGEPTPLVFLSGPSASGKTTTAQKLCERLRESGRGGHVVSLDNFFKGSGEYPLLPDGTEDYEAIEALDLAHLDSCLDELLSTGVAQFPVFDFGTGTRAAERRLLTLRRGETLVIEGIHALSPRVGHSAQGRGVTRVYISAQSGFAGECGPCGDHAEGSAGQELLTPTDLRLLRRMIRDAEFRANPYSGTLERWEHVLAGEQKYILPFAHLADVSINSAMAYEPCLYRSYVSRWLSGNRSTVHSGIARQMAQLEQRLVCFPELLSSSVPKSSLIREFIGDYS